VSASSKSPKVVSTGAGESSEIMINAAGQRPITSETRVVTPEVRQRNYNIIRRDFLNIDSNGRCNPGGVCKEAFEELRSKCGNMTSWTTEDMQRPEVHDLVLAYRTFGVLRDNSPLIPQEQAILAKLIDRQQELNREKEDVVRGNASLGSLEEVSKQKEMIYTNQNTLNDIKRALAEGVNSEEFHIAPQTGGTIRSVWAEPEFMGPSLTASIIKLGDYSLRRSDKDRASDRIPTEPVYGPSTQEEADILLKRLLKFFGMVEDNPPEIEESK
jgi:hypothetical protein